MAVHQKNLSCNRFVKAAFTPDEVVLNCSPSIDTAHLLQPFSGIRQKNHVRVATIRLWPASLHPARAEKRPESSCWVRAG